MNKLSALSLFLLVCGSLSAEESPSKPATAAEAKEAFKESAPTPEIKPSELTKPQTSLLETNDPVYQNRTFTKEQIEAINKEKNWAVEGLKSRREAERAELEKTQLTEKSSLDQLLEKERKSIDERVGKSSSTMGQLKPSIETNWNTVNATGSGNTEKDLAEKKKELKALTEMQNNWAANSFDSHPGDVKESNQAFDSLDSNSTNKNQNGMNNFDSLQNQLNGTKAKTDTNYDYLVSTGQAPNFRKLSNDPNFQPTSGMESSGVVNRQPSNDFSVPSAPKPVTSTMNVETLRQIELQRVNAIPKPDFKELNSKIPSPGTRRF